MNVLSVEFERLGNERNTQLRVLVQRSDRSTAFTVTAPARIALSAFAAWLETPDAEELAIGVHRSAWPVSR